MRYTRYALHTLCVTHVMRYTHYALHTYAEFCIMTVKSVKQMVGICQLIWLCWTEEFFRATTKFQLWSSPLTLRLPD